ncbi:LuxR C-terminal-related transcriptional regulator [Sulfurimonas sp.]|uniref:response regulator transcription factor n=1 Tax=Sulfurimonas sp. TaxID=2022749 RepID=UPI00262C2F55|nr:LuxR C-terminal-related transcriptional regulator [Sulfurimonas sp.]
MKTIFFSTDVDTINEWKSRHDVKDLLEVTNCDALLQVLSTLKEYIIVSDYDSVSHSINKMLASNTLPDKFIVLEKVPEIITGKSLILKGIKAYGNARMLKIHYQQMIETVKGGKIWTYPELTLALAKEAKRSSISDEAEALIEHRLTEKEKEVIYAILEGLTNDAIASELDITQRTVKAHISSIFSKLHVNDRVSLILLLK